MNTINDGGPAFPLPVEDLQCRPRFESGYGGMTLRDYFAAKAMQTLLGSEYTSEHGLHEGWTRALAHESYMIADAMLAKKNVMNKSIPEAVVDAVACAICLACDENPDHHGDARGNEFRWQDYRDVALAAISAFTAAQQENKDE